MRTRALLVIALLVSSADLGAQIRRRPRVDPRTPPQPTPLPPEAVPVNRDLAYKRLRWSADAYSIVSAVEVPAGPGVISRYTAFGAGTHGAYRYTDMLSATVDVTASLLGGPSNMETAEVGTRFSPLPWEQHVRPFFDVRAAYTRLYDSFAYTSPAPIGIPPLGAPGQYANEARYSRGFGGVAGLGVEYSLTNTLALTTEVSAVRNRLTAYNISGPANIPLGSTYWMTSYRYALGIKFSPVRALRLAQNPHS
jgi:hypothetical protein